MSRFVRDELDAMRSFVVYSGGLFGPIVIVWFATISVLGIVWIVREPVVLEAFDPRHAIRFFEATGFAPIVFDAMQALGKNGVLVLSSVTGGDHRIEVPADKINLGFVLGNKVMVGTVNANREYFEMGVKDMAQAEAEYPGWLLRLLTHPVKGLEGFRELMDTLTTARSAIKVFCEVAPL